MPSQTISARAKRVWLRLTDWYGARIAEQYGTTPPPDWCEVVDRSDNELVKRALVIIRSKYLDFPPTFPQFEKAFEPVHIGGSREDTPADRLSNFIVSNYKLTPKQMRGPWTYFGKLFDAQMPDGRIGHNYGVETFGVSIPADGEHRGYRVTLDDIAGFAP